MQAFYLDTYQSKVEEAFQTVDSIIVSGQKMSGRSFLISEICTRQVLAGKHILMVVHDDHQAVLLQKKLMRFLVGDQVLVFDAEELLPGQVHKVLTRIKSTDIAFDEQDFIYKKTRRSQLRGRIRHYYKGLTKPLIFGKSWHELLVLNAFDRHAMETLHFNPLFRIRDMRFDQEEFDRMSVLILKARDFYERAEAHTDRFFIEDIYGQESGIQAWSQIMDWVSEMRKSCVNNLISVGLYINERINTRISHALSTIDVAQGLLDALKVQAELFLEEKEKQSSLKQRNGFFQKTLQPSGDAGQLPGYLSDAYIQVLKAFRLVPGFSFFADAEKIVENTETWDLLDHHISGLYHFLEVFPAYIKETVQKETGKLNIQATDDPALAKLSTELEAFYLKIQEEKILNKTIEPAAFNLDKHMGQLDSILRQLNEVSEKREHFVKCFAFNKFYFSLGPAEQLLIRNMLDLSPKDWALFFKNWFIQNAIDQNGYFFHKLTDPEIREFIKLDLEINRLSQLRQIRAAEPEIREMLDNKNKRLFQQIFNKNHLAREDWKELVQQHPEFIKMLFPVLIVTEKRVQSLTSALKAGFDMVMLDLADSGYDGFLADSSNVLKTKAKTIITVEEGDANTEKLAVLCQPKGQVFELHGYHQQGLMQLADMNHTERLYGARNLAHLIRDVAPDIEIFKLGNVILYSCLSGPLNQLLLAMLDQKGIKKMRVLETPFNLLLENMLDIQSRQLLLTQDGLLNSASFDRIPWQIYIREQAGKAGITSVNLDTLDLREAPVKVFRNFIEAHLLMN